MRGQRVHVERRVMPSRSSTPFERTGFAELQCSPQACHVRGYEVKIFSASGGRPAVVGVLTVAHRQIA